MSKIRVIVEIEKRTYELLKEKSDNIAEEIIANGIPLPNEQIAWEQGYEAGLAQGKQNRPQGEWIKHIDDIWPEDSTQECPFCHEEERLLTNDNFCPNCGAKLIMI